MSTRVHAEAPPVGSVDVITLPAKSTATHDVGDEQLTLETVVDPSMSADVQDVEAGLEEVNTRPSSAVATQSVVEAQEMLSNVVPGSSTAVTQKGVEVDRSVVYAISPTGLTPTHKVLDGHVIAYGLSAPVAIAVGSLQVPPVGFVETRSFPPSSVATQNVLFGQDTLSSALPCSMRCSVQVVLPAAGLVEVNSFP
jgi:hypothetical protein